MKRVSHEPKHLKKVNEFQSHLASDRPSSFEHQISTRTQPFHTGKTRPEVVLPYSKQRVLRANLLGANAWNSPPSQAHC